MNVLIADCETNGFLPNPPHSGPVMDRIWTIQIGTPESEEVDIYADQPGYRPLSEAVNRLKTADRVVIHNGMRFDIHAINMIFPNTLRPEQIYDSLVVARLLDPMQKANSLEDWGKRLGVAKGVYGGDFSRFDQELVDYARQDIVTGRALYLHQQKITSKWDWSYSIWLENLFAYVLFLQEENGFTLNVKKATELAGELRQEQHEIRQKLQEIFPPIVTERWSEKTGKRLKDNVEVFNPGSGQQIAKRLIDKYGWKPKKFTNTGIPATDEKVLSGLRYPEAELLNRYNRLKKQLGQIEDGKQGWLKLVNSKTNRVHGAVNTMGTATGRCSHFAPNIAQVDKKDLRMREVWEAREGWKLVGVDAEGLEFRVLAHYLQPFDKGVTIDRVLNGDKSKGTDVHSANKEATGLYFRDPAKRLIYAMMYGASDTKLGEIVLDDYRLAVEQGIEGATKPTGSRTAIGKKIREKLGKGTVGLNHLIGRVTLKARDKKYIKGIDGRKIFIRSPHSAFNFLLQGAGAIIMKLALVLFHFERVPHRGWKHGDDFAYVANVHDEVQIEARPELAEAIGKEFADCIREAGEKLGCRCPQAGAYDIGNDWSTTH